MELNLPVLQALLSCRNLLIAGIGGGFDIFCGLPLYYELHRRGCRVHLANMTFSDIGRCEGGKRLSSSLVGVTADTAPFSNYCPEVYLAHWFRQEQSQEVTIWCFERTGLRPLREAYRLLVRHLAIDGILLVDGGVDGLLHGDEASVGTLLEDSLTLGAVRSLSEVPLRVLSCLGFGAETDVSHAQVLENIAQLAEEGHYRGACGLVREMEAYRFYEAAVEYVHGQPDQEASVINASVVSAVRGRFGNYHLTEKTRGRRLWISPLMTLFWFFDATGVAQHNYLIAELALTDTFLEAVKANYEAMEKMLRRPQQQIPLP